MKNMTKGMYNKLRRGFNTCGKSMDAFYYVEEDLNCNEVDTIYEFTKWIVENDIAVGLGNIELRIAEFKKYIKANPPVEAVKEELPTDGRLEIAPGVFVKVMHLSL